MEFTKEQQQAIYLRGDSLLVSAAAGSGKTAVLTERVIEKLCADPPTDANRLMILTFTEAAANEMRARISKKLRARLKTHPDPALVRRQISMLPQTQISTIHAACLSLIRKNFEQLGLDPQFSVAEELHLTLMKKDMLDDFLESIYEEALSDADISLVINSMFSGNNDKDLKDALDFGSEFLDKIPYPEMYIDSIDGQQLISAALDISGKKLADICKVYSRIAEGGYGKLSEMWGDELNKLQLVLKAIREGDFDKAVSEAEAVTYQRFNRPKDIPVPEWENYKKLRNDLKEGFSELRSAFLYAPEQQMLADREIELPVIKSYLKLCNRLNGLLQKQRLSERILSYNDLEKFTLKLLIESYDGKTIVKTKSAQELSEFYDEIIVDEYQDCNLVQELIFCALSRDGKNIFAVGDVKQSIYRFRGAEPSLFLSRQKNSMHPTDSSSELAQPTKIDLFCNFRSHGAVLEFINGIFYTLMTKERDIDYNDGHALYVSNRYDDTDAASVDILLYVTADRSKNKATRIEAEATDIARRIKAMIGNEKIFDPEAKCERTIKASDIALILRAPATCGAIYEKALEREGISCINNNPAEKYLDTQEVRETLAFLQTINNPYDDIPLITLMYSDYFSFDTNELGKIRASAKKVLFYEAVKEYAAQDKKTADFLKLLTELRTLSLTSSLYGLINTIYEKTAILTRILSAKDGAKKRANLLMLCDLASSFESSRYKSLFSFITYLLKLAQTDEKMPTSRLRDNPDCVNLMSIHKSKGLEFPVVFFANTSAIIQPAKEKSTMLSPSLGAGGAISDFKSHRFFKGLAHNLIYEKERENGYNEYMRLLYVALTRAGSRLYITGSLKATEATALITSCDMAAATPCGYDIENDGSFLKWVLLPYIRSGGADRLRAFAGLDTVGGDKTFFADVIDTDEIVSDTEPSDADEQKPYRYSEEEVIAMISRNVETEDIPAKLSVSEIKGIRSAEPDSEQLITAKDMFKKPRFLQGGVTGADRGSATHKFLQFCDFEKVGTQSGFESEKQRLIDYEFITPRDSELVDSDGVIRFVNSDIMRALLKDYRMRKEERFMFTLKARELLDTDSDRLITVQGVLDCLFEKDGHAIIVDYKTDRVKDERELIDRYSVQLDMYARAVKINEGLETDRKYIYSFALQKFITV